MWAKELQSTHGGSMALSVVGSISQTFTAAGTTQATATAISAVKTFVDSAANGSGAILPSGLQPSDEGVVCNGTTVNVYLYPPVGGKINGGTTNMPVMIATNRAVIYTCIDGTNFMVNT